MFRPMKHRRRCIGLLCDQAVERQADAKGIYANDRICLRFDSKIDSSHTAMVSHDEGGSSRRSVYV